MSQFSRAIYLLSVVLVASCVNTKSVTELEQIQGTQGFLTKSLYYVGSSGSFHYFDQANLLGDGWWMPGYESDGYRTYRVTRDSLAIPANWEFRHSSYQGEPDSRRVKVRIRSAPTPRVEPRVYPHRSLDDYRLKQTGPAKWTVERIR